MSQNFDRFADRFQIQQLVGLVHDAVQLVTFFGLKIASLADIEVGQLLVGEPFAEFALDDGEKVPGRVAQHIVHVDVDGPRGASHNSKNIYRSAAFKRCASSLPSLWVWPALYWVVFHWATSNGSLSVAVEQIWMHGFFKAWAKPAS